MPQVIQETARHFGAARLSVVAPLRGGGVLRSIGRALHRVIGWSQRSRQRDALSMLDERLLGDIGISRAAAAEEAAKPFCM